MASHKIWMVAAFLVAAVACAGCTSGPEETSETAFYKATPSTKQLAAPSASGYQGDVQPGDHPKVVAAIEACEDNEARGCVRAGVLLLQPDKPTGFDRAVGFLKQGCAADLLEGCRRVAGAYLAPKYKRVDYGKAAPFMHKSCQLGDARACDALLVLVRHKPEVYELSEQDRIAALHAACERASPRVCGHLGSFYRQKGDTPKMWRAAADAFERGCARGDTYSCSSLARVYSFGRGRKRDPARAVELYESLCVGQSHASSCHNLGVMYAAGDGVEKDDERAAELYGKACDMGSAWACADFAGRLRTGWATERNVVRGFGIAKRSCHDAGSSYACWMLGLYYKSGSGTTQDLEKAIELFSGACKEDVDDACHSAGLLLLDHPELSEVEASYYFARTAKLTAASCARNRGRSCGTLADLYQQGRGVPKNEARAIELLEKACSLDPRECEE